MRTKDLLCQTGRQRDGPEESQPEVKPVFLSGCKPEHLKAPQPAADRSQGCEADFFRKGS